MVNKQSHFVSVPMLAISIVGGLLFYLIKFSPPLNAKMIAIVALIFTLAVIPLYRSIRQAEDLKAQIPIEDEMLGIGILRSSAIYGIILIDLKKIGIPHAEQV